MSVSNLIKSGAEPEQIYEAMLDNPIRDDIPHIWYKFLESQVQLLDSREYWKAMNSKPCYIWTKTNRRYFPMVKDQEFNQLLKKAQAENSDFNDAKHSNYKTGANTKFNSNFNFVFSIKLSEIKKETENLLTLFKILQHLKLDDLTVKCWYLVSHHPKLCHLVLTDLHRVTLALYKKEPSLVTGAMFWTNYVLVMDEETAKHSSLDSRYLMELNPEWNWMANIPPDINPMLTGFYGKFGNVYTSTAFYLKGDRSIVTMETFKTRLDLLTSGCLKGLEAIEQLAIVGSIVTECATSNPLVPVGEDFLKRDQQYYPNSDIDIVISVQSYKDFIQKAFRAIEIMSSNLNEPLVIKENICASGVRFHLSSPRLKRKIELFRSPLSHADLVAGFHCPCVRMYYDFTKIRATRSCVAALLTGINNGFSWYSSNKIPIAIDLKVAQRGWATTHNAKELTALVDFMKTSPEWRYDVEESKDVNGVFTKNHLFFRLDSYKMGVAFGTKLEDTAKCPKIDASPPIYTLSATPTYKKIQFERYTYMSEPYVNCPPELGL